MMMRLRICRSVIMPSKVVPPWNAREKKRETGEPKSREERIILNTDTVTAQGSPRQNKATAVAMFASPGLKPGSGI